MAETLAAYWAPRADRPEEAARWLVALLKQVDLGTWHTTGRSTPRPEDAVALEAESVTALLEAGRNRRDTDASVIDELGCSVSLWTETVGGVAKLTARVGTTSTARGLGNNVLLKLPEHHQLHDRADAVFASLVEATGPDRAIWTTRDYRRTQPLVDGHAVVGWQTYLTPPLTTRLRTSSAGATARPLARGTWVTTGPRPDAESVATAAAVAQTLSS